MSTALAIAATTRVLSALISHTIEHAASAAPVLSGPPYLTSKAPDQVETEQEERAQLSLFLYHVTYNQGWREAGLPSRNGSGTGVDRPPLALDLHYLLIAYGDAEYVPQILLGLGMQALHETPFLYRQQIARVFSPPHPLSTLDSALSTAGLADQVEMIKVTPEPLTTEDLSKLWTAFGSKYRPSVGYEATVVLIDAAAPVQAALPVRTYNIDVLQLAQPSIGTVAPQYLPWNSAIPLTLTGANLSGHGGQVVFDNNLGAPQVPEPVGTGGGTVTTAVPPLPAGLNPLRIVQQVAIGAPPPKNVVQSNVALFYLQPVIRREAAPPHDFLIMVGPPDPSQTPATTPVTVQLDPVMQPTQQVQLLLNELAPPAGAAPLSFTFDAGQAQISGNSVTFATFGTRAGAYLLRVRVDGGESDLVYDQAAQAYTGPEVTL